MKTKHRQTHSSSTSPTVMEAIETLSTIANYDVESNTEHSHIDSSDQLKQIQWLDLSKGNGKFKKILTVILSYLKKFYKNEYSYLTDPETLEGIKAIMVLVGEAAKNIDNHPSLFKNKTSVTQLKEYKHLNEFYNTRISHQMDEGILGKWILAISQQTQNRQKELYEQQELKSRASLLSDAPRHLFVNLEAVKKDSEYELFYIRKEDGSLFFSPRLLRNIKLICDFSSGELSKDPVVDMPLWVDFEMQSAAKVILHSLHELTEHFFHECVKYRHRELVATVNKCLMALYLSANANNLSRDLPDLGENRKNCRDYFTDFLSFLHEALHSAEYHKIITYPTTKGKGINSILTEILQGICRSIYLSLHCFNDFDITLQHLLTAAYEGQTAENYDVISAKNKIHQIAENEYTALTKRFKNHSKGPLAKTLASIKDGFLHSFDPFTQLNLPSQLYAMAFNSHKIVNLHLPSPTTQEYIHRVSVLDEFKGFLRSCMSEFPHHKHLIINLQDRTSWREHFRSIALEELRTYDFDKSIVVVTLAKDTDFYHQLAPYKQENHVEIFLKHFKAHLGDENSGYYFPTTIKSAILTNFAEGVMGAIHRIFFSNKNILIRDHRLDFIEIFDLFLTLKLMDIVNPNSFSLTCKDGVDISSSCNALLFIFLKMLGKEAFDQETWTQLNRVLHAPAILLRERLMLKERFDRMISALKAIEFVYHDLGHEEFGRVMQEAFGHYYTNPIFDSSVVAIS